MSAVDGTQALDDDRQRPDGVAFRLLMDLAENALERGLAQEEAVRVATTAFVESLPTFAGIMTTSLHRRKADLIADRARERAALAERIDELWGTALSTYEAVAQVAAEINARVYNAYVEDNDNSSDVTAEVAFVLHARACTTAAEVLCLMRSGLADGAAARRRTIHELSVVLNLVVDHQQLDLAQRYVDYAIVERWGDIEQHQLHAAALGYAPILAPVVAEAEQQYQDMLRKYGDSFRKRNRWAAPLFAAERDVQFVELERLAGLERWRPLYRESNHHVHAGPFAAERSIQLLPVGQTIRIGAHDEHDVSEVGTSALISLLQCTAALGGLADVGEDPEYLMMLMCMHELVDHAGLAFERIASRL
ncbi:DUF5677 domain-containing protein [Dactylosporangium sp. CA-233914]|uniref:DUF5677 domain-containing protein n=1 Tax=Dactylosporangium sp. CA-233914 TaxID=3239934 RepID=UPI003D94046B